jgi:hypothetical protein
MSPTPVEWLTLCAWCQKVELVEFKSFLGMASFQRVAKRANTMSLTTVYVVKPDETVLPDELKTTRASILNQTFNVELTKNREM